MWFINEERCLSRKKKKKPSKKKVPKSRRQKPRLSSRAPAAQAMLPSLPAARTATMCTTTSVCSPVLSSSLLPLAPPHQHCWNCIFRKKVWALCHWVNFSIYSPPTSLTWVVICQSKLGCYIIGSCSLQSQSWYHAVHDNLSKITQTCLG